MRNNVANSVEKSINYQMKLLYAFGMLFIVANHCGKGGISFFYEFFQPYSFHVPLFVFCSGYFYSSKVEATPWKYMRKKMGSLIVPLYVWNFVYALIAQLLSLQGFSIGVSAGINFQTLLIGPITPRLYFDYNLAGWFVVPLFLTQMLTVFSRRFLSAIIKKEHRREILYYLFSYALGMLGIFLASKGYRTGWQLLFTRSLFFVPFFCTGFLYAQVLEKHDTLSNFWYFFFLFSTTLSLIVYHGQPLAYQIALSDYNSFSIWPIIVGLLGIAFWLRIARILAPSIGRDRCVTLVADGSFSIMLHHLLGFMIVKAICAAVAHNTVFFQDFDWNAYYNDLWYFYCPKGLEQTRIVYIFIGMAFGVAIDVIVKACKGSLTRWIKQNKKKSVFVYGAICLLICMVCGGGAWLIANRG